MRFRMSCRFMVRVDVESTLSSGQSGKARCSREVDFSPAELQQLRIEMLAKHRQHQLGMVQPELIGGALVVRHHLKGIELVGNFTKQLASAYQVHKTQERRLPWLDENEPAIGSENASCLG